MRSYSVHTRLVNSEGEWIYTGGFQARNRAEARVKAAAMVSNKYRALFEVKVIYHPKRKNACGNP